MTQNTAPANLENNDPQTATTQDNTPMGKFIARLSILTAVLLHPLLMPIYCAILTLYTVSPYAMIPHAVKTSVMIYVGLYACINPLVVIGLFLWAGKVSDLQMPTRKERVWPLICTATVIGLSLFLLTPNNTPRPLFAMVIGEGLLLMAAGICSIFWKISLHSAGSGALLAFVSVTGMAYNLDFATWAAAAFIAAFVTAWTRLYQKAHTPRQLIAGYALGIIVMGLTLNHIMQRPVF